MAKLTITSDKGGKILFGIRFTDDLVPTVVSYLREVLKQVASRRAEQRVLSERADDVEAAQAGVYEVTKDLEASHG